MLDLDDYLASKHPELDENQRLTARTTREKRIRDRKLKNQFNKFLRDNPGVEKVFICAILDGK